MFNIRHTAYCSEDAFQTLRCYRPGGWKTKLVLEGEEHLRQALEAGRGAVLWVAHFGMTPLATKKAMSDAGYKVWHLSTPEHGYSRSRFGVHVTNRICTHIENHYLAGRILIDRDHPARATAASARQLRDNRFISITAQPSEGKKIAYVNLFGALFELAIGAPSLAMLCGSALLPVYTVRDEASGVIRVIVGEQLTVPDNLNKEQRLMFLAQSFADRLVPYVMKYPEQWRNWRGLTFTDMAPEHQRRPLYLHKPNEAPANFL